MDYLSLVNNISFSFLDPMATPGADGLYMLPRGDGSSVRLLQLPEAPFDIVNTRLPRNDNEMRLQLGDICKIPRMSTFAIAAIINWGVRQMPADLAFVNIGVWNGFTLLSGMLGNSNKRCIGVDNFSEFGGPREDFHARFERHRSPNHHFYDMDYSEYLRVKHQEPIGFYIYDGEHSYENQLRGLQLAERFFADGCLILVDDTNWPEPRQATLDFIGQSPHTYRIVFDASTSGNHHPTFWNGVMVLQRVGQLGTMARGVVNDGLRGRIERSSASAIGSDEAHSQVAPLVSIIVGANTGRQDVVELAIDCAIRQTYRNTEVIAVHSGAGRAKRAVARFGSRVIAVQSDRSGEVPAFRAGLRRSRGDFVCLVRSEDALRADAVEAAIADDWGEHILIRRSIRELETLIPTGDGYILVDENRWGLPETVVGRRRIPFLERDGQYWGKPPDDETAIRELERLRASGAQFMVFGWPALWWLDYYQGLRDYLRAHFSCVLENKRLVLFDLRQ
jgi:hypothetical protein